MTEVAQMYVSIGARLDDLDRKLGQAEAKVHGSARRMDSASRRFGRSVGVIGGAAATGGLLAAGLAIGKVGRAAATLDSTFAELAAKTGASRRELDALRRSAETASTRTKYSASEAAGAQLELAKAGLSASQVLGGGLAASLDLAAAGNMGLEDSAVAVANALQLFKLPAKDASRVADLLAGASNTTSANVKDMADALKMGGGAAKAVGYSFQDTMVALTALGKAGYRGSDAGTSLKTTLLQLAGPSKESAKVMKDLGLSFFDSRGQMKSLADVSQMLRDRTKGLTDQQRAAAFSQLVGADGIRTLLALYDAGPKKLGAYERAIAKQGEAHRIANQMNQTAAGELRRLGNSAETAGTKLATRFMPYVEQAAGGLADMVGGAVRDGTIDRWADLTITAVGRIGSAVEAAADGDIIGAFGNIADLLTPAVSNAKALRDAMRGAAADAADLAILRGNETTAGGQLAQAQIGLKQARRELAGAKRGTDEWRDAMAKVSLWQGRVAQGQKTLNAATAKAQEVLHKAYGDQNMGRFATQVEDARDKVGRLKDKLAELEASPGPFTNAEADVVRGDLSKALDDLAAAESNWNRAKGNANRLNQEYLKGQANTARALMGMPALTRRAEVSLGRLSDNLARGGVWGNRAKSKVMDWTIRTNADQQIPRVAKLVELADKAGKGRRAIRIVADAKTPQQAIQRLLDLFPKVTKPKTASVKANVTGKSDVDALIARIAAVQSKSATVRVTTIYDTVRRDGERHGAAGAARGAVVGLAGGGSITRGRVRGGLGQDSVLAMLKPGERVVNEWQWGLIRSGVDPDRAMNMTGALRLAKGLHAPAKKSGEEDDAYRDRVRTWGDRQLDAAERSVGLMERRHARMQRALERDGFTSSSDLRKVAMWQRQEAGGYTKAAKTAEQVAAEARRLGFGDVAREWSQRARDLRETAKDRRADAKDTDAREPDQRQRKTLEELLGKEWDQAQLEAAKASTTATKTDDIAALQKQKKLLEKLVKTTKRRDILTQAYNELGNVQDRIASLQEEQNRPPDTPDTPLPDSSGGDGGGGYSGGSYGGGGPSTVTLQQYITVQGNVWTTKEFAKELRDEFVKMGREMGGNLWAGVG